MIFKIKPDDPPRMNVEWTIAKMAELEYRYGCEQPGCGAGELYWRSCMHLGCKHAAKSKS